jgi:excisionase family DNA binding protein
MVDKSGVEKLLSYKDAAQVLGVSERTIWNMAHVYKTLKFITVGKRLRRIPVQAINDYLEQSIGA